MDDATFLAELEAATLDASLFDHRAHVRAGFLILSAEPGFGAALARMERAIRRFAAANGKDGLYHETITVAFMALINERMAGGAASDWQSFEKENPDLFDGALLGRYYSKDFLALPGARATFHLPRVA